MVGGMCHGRRDVPWWAGSAIVGVCAMVRVCHSGDVCNGEDL